MVEAPLCCQIWKVTNIKMITKFNVVPNLNYDTYGRENLL